MDDAGWSWPAWKFGMRRDELFTTLHDQYNTFPSTIQDPDAFHHDVYELSNEAATIDEFHRLMASRKAQRLCELNESLESASVEIIANPSLIGTTQWEFALQLFRTRSLDSLVRYFASYLPADHPWHRETADEPVSCDTSPTPFFNDRRLMEEPSSFSSSASSHDLPPSPRSLTTCSNNSESSVQPPYSYESLTPPRTLSFSGSESDHFHDDDLKPETSFRDDASFQSSGPDTPESVSEVDETAELNVPHESAHTPIIEILDECTQHECLPSELAHDASATALSAPSKSATPIPSCTPIFFDVPQPTLLSVHHRSHSRSLSPSRSCHLADVAAPDSLAYCRKAAPLHRPSRRSPRLGSISPTDYSDRTLRSRTATRRRDARQPRNTGRIQKSEPMLTRLRERRQREAAEDRYC